MPRKLASDRALTGPSVRVVHARASVATSPDHTHDEAMLFVPLSGSLRFTIDRRTYVADGLHALAVRAHTPHRHATHTEAEYLVAYLDDRHLGTAPRVRRFPNTALVRELAGELLAALGRAADPEVVHAIGIVLAAQVSRTDRGHVDVDAPLPADDRLARAIRHARVHYREDPSTADLARAAGMSPRTFERALLRACGTTPRKLVEDLRLAEARDRLATGRETVTAVAYELGYKSLSHFVRRYRRAFGTTPTGRTRG